VLLHLMLSFPFLLLFLLLLVKSLPLRLMPSFALLLLILLLLSFQMLLLEQFPLHFLHLK